MVAITTRSLRVPAVLGYRFRHPSAELFHNFRLYCGVAAKVPLAAKADAGALVVDAGSFELGAVAGGGMDISNFFVDLGYHMAQKQAELSGGMRLVLGDARRTVPGRADAPSFP
jgi:hypothetical protein